MPRTRSVSVTEAARNFAELVNCAYYKGDTIVLLKNGTPVARIVPPPEVRRLTGAEFAEAWDRRTRLPPDEAEAFARDIQEARDRLEPPRDPWA